MQRTMENHSRPGGGGGRNHPSNRNRKSKNKRSRKRDNSRRNGGSGSRGGGNNNNKRNKGPPSPPQTKVVIRNIGDLNKYGCIKDVIELIRSVIEGANQKLSVTTSRIIQLDEASVECLIREEEAVLKAEAEKAMKESSNGHKEEENPIENDNQKADENGEEVAPEVAGEAPADDTLDKSEKSAHAVVSSVATETPSLNLGARLVYIVPPKQTRRRGIKPGCAYLVISGPTIEAKDPPPVVPTSDPTPSDPSKEEKKESNEEKEEEETGASWSLVVTWATSKFKTDTLWSN